MRILIGIVLVLSCLFSVSVTKFLLDIPRTLWVFWDSEIDKAPIMVQLCLSKMRAVCQQQNWTLIVLNQTNLHQYIPNYEIEFMSVRRNAAHPDWKAALSDLIRLNVIAANGGVYMDITTILFEGLGWLDRLDQIPYLLTNSQIEKGVQPDCIVPYIAFYQNSAETRDSEGRITNWLPGYEAWFFAAKKNAIFIQKWRRNHQKHFQLRVQQNGREQIEKGYFLRHNLGGDYLIVDKSAFQVIQQQQAKLDRHVSLFGERKNVNKEFKILGLHGEFGPFSLYLGYLPREQDFISLTIEEIEQKYLAPIHFFVKLANTHRTYFDGVFRKLKQISQGFGSAQKAFEKFMVFGPSSLDCDTVKFIVKGSVLGGLIQNNPKAQSQQIFSITVQQRDEWYKYCKNTFRIDLNRMQFYDNLYYYISRCIQIGELINMIHPWASWLKFNFDDYMKKVFRESILPPKNWMGWLVQPAETLFWEKRYQKRLKQDGDPFEIPKFHGLAQVFTHDYSQIDLIWMRLRMWVFEHRVDIITWTLHWIGFMAFFAFFSLLYLAVSFAFWLSYNIYKYNIRPLIWIIMVLIQPQMIQPVKKSMFKHFQQIKEIYHSANEQKYLKWTKTAVNYILFNIIKLIIGAAFFGYYTFILYYYDAVLNNGKIYEQQWTFLIIILGQIFFRFLGLWIGDQASIFPGIRFKFLYYLFLPVYYYFFGAQILSLVRPFENQNFTLAFFIALCMPLIVKLIEHEMRCGIKKIILKPEDRENSPKIFAYNFHSVLANFTFWIEKAVIAFLIVIIFTNLRFMKSSEGYILVRFLDRLAKSKLPWIILLAIYTIKSLLQAFDAIEKTQKIAALYQQSRKQESRTIANQKIKRGIPSKTSSLFNQQINSKIDWIKLFALECLKSLIIITKYILRAYTVYVLLFNNWIEYMISHVFQINFDHTFMKISFMTVHFAFVYINFLVEIYLEEEYFAFLQLIKSSTDTVSFKMDESLNEDVRISNDAQKDRFQESDNMNNKSDYKNYQVLLSLCQIVTFILPRIWVILKFYQFFNPNNFGMKFQKIDFQSGLILMVYSVLFGYAILMPFMRTKLKSKHSKAIPLQINNYNQLLPSQDGQIELKQQQTNHD